MKKLTIAITALALSFSAAFGQSVGKLQPGNVWGNSGATAAYGKSVSVGAIFDQQFTCSARGSILFRGSSAWTCLAPGTVNRPLLSGGAGADIAYGLMPVGSLATGTQDTVVGYWGSTTASALAINNCANSLTYSTATHTFGCNAGAGTGSVTSVAAGTGMSFSSITASGSVAIDKATSANLEAGASNKVLTADNIFDAEVNLGNSGSGTLGFDFNTFLNARVTMTGNISTLNCTNMKASQSGAITIVQDGSGTRTMVAGWCSAFRWANGTRGVLSTAINTIDVLFYQCISTTICYVSLSKAQAN